MDSLNSWRKGQKCDQFTMSKNMRLDIGFVRTDNLKDEVLMELLDHLGIVYVEASTRDFPCTIVSTNPDSGRSCEGNNLIVADEVVPLDEIAMVLSGERVDEEDSFKLTINICENKILQAIRRAFQESGYPLIRKWFWPNFSKACCILTHDVDWLSYSPFHRVTLRKESLRRMIGLAVNYLLQGEDYGYNIPEILELEGSRKLKSTFFFRTDYGKMNELARKALKLIKDAGFEIGLHGARESHVNIEVLKEERKLLEENVNSQVQGIRYHRLKFRKGRTWNIEDDVGFKYDATLSYREEFGFISGLCHPYHPIDLVRKRRLILLEMPTAFMDWAALHRKFNEGDIKKTLSEIMVEVERYNGCFAVNFHNTYLNKKTFEEVYNTYVWTMNELIARGYWLTTAIDFTNWWNMRNSLSLDIRLKDDYIVGNSSLSGVPIVIEKTNGEMINYIAVKAFKIKSSYSNS